MKRRIVLLLSLTLLTGCAKMNSSALPTEPDYDYVAAVDVENTMADTIQSTKVSKYVPAPAASSVSDEAIPVEEVTEEVSENMVHTTVLPDGMHYEGHVIYTDDPKDFRKNALLYTKVLDLSGNRVFSNAEALAYAEIDFVHADEKYDGSRPLRQVSVSTGNLDIENDYKLPAGVYQFTTDLPLSHITLYTDKMHTVFGQYYLTSDSEETLELEVREGTYAHGNSVTFTKVSDLPTQINNGITAPQVNIEDYTVSHNVVSYNKINGRY